MRSGMMFAEIIIIMQLFFEWFTFGKNNRFAIIHKNRKNINIRLLFVSSIRCVFSDDKNSEQNMIDIEEFLQINLFFILNKI